MSQKQQNKLGFSNSNLTQLGKNKFLSLLKHKIQTKQLLRFTKVDFMVQLPQQSEMRQATEDEHLETVQFVIQLQQQIKQQPQNLTSNKQIIPFSAQISALTSLNDKLSKLFQSSYWQKQQNPKDAKQDNAKNLMKVVNQDLSVIRNIVSTFSHKKEAIDGEKRTKKIKFY